MSTYRAEGATNRTPFWECLTKLGEEHEKEMAVLRHEAKVSEATIRLLSTTSAMTSASSSVSQRVGALSRQPEEGALSRHAEEAFDRIKDNLDSSEELHVAHRESSTEVIVDDFPEPHRDAHELKSKAQRCENRSTDSIASTSYSQFVGNGEYSAAAAVRPISEETKLLKWKPSFPVTPDDVVLVADAEHDDDSETHMPVPGNDYVPWERRSMRLGLSPKSDADEKNSIVTHSVQSNYAGTRAISSDLNYAGLTTSNSIKSSIKIGAVSSMKGDQIASMNKVGSDRFRAARDARRATLDLTFSHSCTGTESSSSLESSRQKVSVCVKPSSSVVSIYDIDDSDVYGTGTGGGSVRYESHETSLKVIFELRKEWEAPLGRKGGSRSNFEHRISRWASKVRTSLERKEECPLQECSSSSLYQPNCFTRHILTHPRSRKRITWDLTAMVIIAFDCVFIPLQAFPGDWKSTFFTTLTWFIRLFWTVDIFASCCVGYYVRGVLETSFSKIVRNYFVTWFPLDLLVVGVDWVLLFESSSAGSLASIGKSLRVMRFMRTLRLLRLVKLRRMIRQIHDRIESEVVSVYFSVSVTLLQLLAINHMVACAWYGITALIPNGYCTGIDWVHTNNMENESVGYLYTTSLHWSLTQFTPASMNVGPTNTIERSFTVTVVLVGLVIFSSFVGRITNSTSQLWNREAVKHRQLWLLRRYLRKNAVAKKLSQRIQQYLEYVVDQENEAVRAQDIAILSKLSVQLRQELDLDVHEESLQNYYVFGYLKENHGRLPYRKSLEGAISSELFAKGDVLFFGGEAADYLMCIIDGEMLYKRPWDNNAKDIKQGMWICEATLWTTWLHVGDMRTVTEATVLLLHSALVAKNIARIGQAWRHVRIFGARYVKALNQSEEPQLSDLSNPLFICPAFHRGDGQFRLNTESEKRREMGRCGWLRRVICGENQFDDNDSSAGYLDSADRCSQQSVGGSQTNLGCTSRFSK